MDGGLTQSRIEKRYKQSLKQYKVQNKNNSLIYSVFIYLETYVNKGVDKGRQGRVTINDRN